jgi:hypothetical protein
MRLRQICVDITLALGEVARQIAAVDENRLSALQWEALLV